MSDPRYSYIPIVVPKDKTAEDLVKEWIEIRRAALIEYEQMKPFSWIYPQDEKATAK